MLMPHMHQEGKKSFTIHTMRISGGKQAPQPFCNCLNKGKDFGFHWASQVLLAVKNLPAEAGDIRDIGSIPGWGRFPWRRAWHPTPVFLPGESDGQRSLAGYSPQRLKELDMTEVTQHARTWLGQGQGGQRLGLHGLNLLPAPREGESIFLLVCPRDEGGWGLNFVSS